MAKTEKSPLCTAKDAFLTFLRYTLFISYTALKLTIQQLD